MSEMDIETSSNLAEEHMAVAMAGLDDSSVKVRPSRVSVLRPDTPDGVCANCATVLVGAVCHACGQSADQYKRPVWRLVREGLSDAFALDGRVARTIVQLFVFPGSITRSYLKGRRRRYVPPLRLYLLASLVFFLTLPLINPYAAIIRLEPVEIETGRSDIRLADQGLAPDALQRHTSGRSGNEAANLELTGSEASQPATGAGDAEQQPADQAERIVSIEEDRLGDRIEAMRRVLVPEDFGSSASGTHVPRNWRSFVADRAERLLRNPERWASESLAWAPRLMFMMVPVFALCLGLVHLWRAGFLYFDHLVVALHFQAATFIATSLAIFISLISGTLWAFASLFAYICVYLYRVLRVVYSNNRFKSALSVLFLMTFYPAIIVIVIIFIAIIGTINV